MLSCNLSFDLFKDKKLKSYKQALHPVQGSFRDKVNMAESIEIVFQHFAALTFRKTAIQRMEERGNYDLNLKAMSLKSSCFHELCEMKKHSRMWMVPQKVI